MGHLVILAQFACINTSFSCPCGRPNLLEPNETELHGDLARPVVFKRLLSVMLVHVLVLVAFFGPFYHFANPVCLSILDRRLHPAQPTAASTSSSSTRAAEFRLPENSASSASSLATSPLPLFIGRGVDIPLPEDAGLDDNRTVSPTASPRSIPTEGDTDEEQGELARSLESHFRQIDAMNLPRPPLPQPLQRSRRQVLRSSASNLLPKAGLPQTLTVTDGPEKGGVALAGGLRAHIVSVNHLRTCSAAFWVALWAILLFGFVGSFLSVASASMSCGGSLGHFCA